MNIYQKCQYRSFMEMAPIQSRKNGALVNNMSIKYQFEKQHAITFKRAFKCASAKSWEKVGTEFKKAVIMKSRDSRVFPRKEIIGKCQSQNKN